MLPGAPLMPGVQIALVGPSGNPFPAVGLVDSGADWSLFPKPLAAPLGVDLAACKQVTGGDAGGGSARWVFAPGIDAQFEGRTIHLGGWFGPVPIVLLGRLDFFTAFRQVAFNQNKQSFTISD